MLESFTAGTFSPRLHERFTLLDDGDPLEVELVEVTELGTATGEQRAPFSLVFRGPSRPPLPQRIVRQR